MSEDNEMISDSEEALNEAFLNESEPETPEEGSADSAPSETLESEKGKNPGEEKKGVSSLFSEFMSQFQGESTAEGKIRHSIDFMRASLSNTGTPRFKDFWEGRRICLPLFKENISPKMRSQLWGLYIELSTEATRL